MKSPDLDDPILTHTILVANDALYENNSRCPVDKDKISTETYRLTEWPLDAYCPGCAYFALIDFLVLCGSAQRVAG
jgi:hypothetical protein